MQIYLLVAFEYIFVNLKVQFPASSKLVPEMKFFLRFSGLFYEFLYTITMVRLTQVGNFKIRTNQCFFPNRMNYGAIQIICNTQGEKGVRQSVT